ncbi:MAG TPA: exodeoxyribonuclease V subunit gamma [Chitinispirillaceae bacterium]|nr:exodeoxyribonuclease V subunit gamma [Chitinispirillaceae bacterium]
MPGFNLITSNRLEHLIALLAKSVSQPLHSPLSQEIIIVQNRGMERVLSLRLAEKLGIWANCTYPFPSEYIQLLFKSAFPELPNHLPFDPLYLSFRIFDQLPHCLEHPAYKEISSYLNNAPANGLFDLAVKIADQFDRYTVYRSSLVDRWSKGEEVHWQADLWRRLNTGESDHRVQIKHRFLQHLIDKRIPAELLPERLSIFGVSTLPPFHFEVLSALATETSIDYYLLNPCAEFWDDIIPEKLITKKINSLKKRTRTISAENQHFEVGNPLLASLGKYGQEFIGRLHTLEAQEYPIMSYPGNGSHLHIIQSDILYLISRPDTQHTKIPFNKSDRSIQLHSVHNIMREIEVLYDQLLEMFRTIPDLKASDIIVMAPDINEYASAIDAVFGSGDLSEKKIYYSMADRAGKTFSRIRTICKLLLTVPQSRFSVGTITELLDFEEIREAFGLSSDDCEMVSRWIEATGIKWSIDGSMKQKFDCPPYEENTWKRGLDQLLLGYALPSQQCQSFRGLYGYEHIEGMMGSVLGNFITFFRTLSDFDQFCRTDHTLTDWSSLLCSIINRCIKPNSTQVQEFTQIHGFIKQFVEIQTVVHFDSPVSFDLIKRLIIDTLDAQSGDQAFFNGGVTFCSMLPMRGIPFRIVCCIGMNDADFPRKSPVTTWDLIAADPQPGDRNTEKEDRFLFLEAILSARDILYMSFIKDPREKSSGQRQSVLIDELLDYCQQVFTFGETKLDESAPSQQIENITIADVLITRHRLQGFNPAYFDVTDHRLFSYSKENLAAATALISPHIAHRSMIESPLPAPENDTKTIEIADFIRFFSCPAAFLLTQRLGVYPGDSKTEIDELEPFDIQGLERYHLTNDLITASLTGNAIDQHLRMEAFRGTLPHGAAGEYYSFNVADEITPFISKLKETTDFYTTEERPVTINAGEYTLTGSLNGVCDRGVFHFYYSNAKAVHHIKIWLTHCIWSHFKHETSPGSLLICKDQTWQYGPVPDTTSILAQLCNLYYRGIRQPLHFFPESSWVFIQSLRIKNKSLEEALAAAQKVWLGNDFSKMAPESEKVGNNTFFNGIDPFGQEFIDVSTTVFDPLVESLIKV